MSEDTIGYGVAQKREDARTAYLAWGIIFLGAAYGAWMIRHDTITTRALPPALVVAGLYCVVRSLFQHSGLLIIFIPLVGLSLMRTLGGGLDPQPLQFMQWYGWSVVLTLSLVIVFDSSMRLLRRW